MNPAFTLDSTYIHLRPDESALAMEGGAAFWRGIGERHDLDQGRLMGSTDQSKDWDHWERHPAGDEILTLLSGEMTIVLEIDGEVIRKESLHPVEDHRRITQAPETSSRADISRKPHAS